VIAFFISKSYHKPKTALADGSWQLSRLRIPQITRMCGTHPMSIRRGEKPASTFKYITALSPCRPVSAE
jgi:hypothetical protein